MNDLDELIEIANKLCNTLDKASENEKKFCYNVCDQLERMSWESFRMANDLKYIKENLC